MGQSAMRNGGVGVVGSGVTDHNESEQLSNDG